MPAEDLENLIEELIVVNQRAHASTSATLVQEADLAQDSVGALALGNAFRRMSLSDAPHLLLEFASSKAAWFVQQNYDQSMAVRKIDGEKVYSFMTFLQLPGENDEVETKMEQEDSDDEESEDDVPSGRQTPLSQASTDTDWSSSPATASGVR